MCCLENSPKTPTIYTKRSARFSLHKRKYSATQLLYTLNLCTYMDSFAPQPLNFTCNISRAKQDEQKIKPNFPLHPNCIDFHYSISSKQLPPLYITHFAFLTQQVRRLQFIVLYFGCLYIVYQRIWLLAIWNCIFS